VDSAMRRAFTLTELVVAMGVAALLATLSLAAYGYAQRQARINGDISTVQSILQAVSAYYAVNGCYPPDPQGATMPAGLSPYMGGQWPTGTNGTYFEYNAWQNCAQPWTCPATQSGQTAYYIGAEWDEPQYGLMYNHIWIVNNSPVPIC
jgi:prepilin-type N-terminal cleavage/methylation domain-containing protein